MIRVLIVDDKALLRKSIGHIISIDDEIDVVDMAANGQEAVEACKKLRPDIVLMDIEMPVMNGIEALKIIKGFDPPLIKVIILTTFENSSNIIESFIGDADGYITKDSDCDELIATIRCVNYGLAVIHKSVKSIMVDKFKKNVCK